MNWLRSFGAFLFLGIICVIAYWDIAFLNDTLKWDMLDCYYPWRYFVGECVQNRVFPYWNPYQHFGYPIHADMRSVFYPEGLLVGLFGGYDLKVFQFLFIFYISMAGLGMYRLASCFVKSSVAAITVAAGYILSGFFIGHGQELAGIIGACWIPWVLYYFVQFQKSLSWAHLWWLSLFLFLQLTGGYQALSLILFYLLVLLWVVAVFQRKEGLEPRPWTKILGMNAALAVLIILSLSALVFTYVQVSPQVERLTGLTLTEAYIGLVSPRALISLLTPFSVTVDAAFLGTNVTMANVYVGVIILALALIGFFVRKGAVLWVLVFFGVVSFMASLGPLTPVREFLFNYVPGMNLFRMSSFFSYFSQVALFLLAAVAIDRIVEHPPLAIKKLGLAVGSVLLMIGAVAIWAANQTAEPTALFQAFLSGVLLDELTGDYYQKAVFHAGIQVLMLLAVLGSLLLFRKQPRGSTYVLALMILTEMLVSSRLNFDATVGGGHDHAEMQAKLDAQLSDFPIPDVNRPIGLNSETKPALTPLFHNTNILSKTVSWDGFNSFQLDRFKQFEKTGAFKEAQLKPLVYATSEEALIAILSFEPTRIACSVTTDEACALILQQTHYPGWKVELNSEEIDVELVHDIFPKVPLTTGTHSVVFVYENPWVGRAFGLSVVVLLVILFGCAFHVARSHDRISVKQAALVALTSVVLLLLIGGYGWSTTSTMEDKRNEAYLELLEVLKPALDAESALLLNVDNPKLLAAMLTDDWQGDTRSANGTSGASVSKLDAVLDSIDNPTVVYAGTHLKENRTVLELIRMRYPSVKTVRNGDGYVHVFSKEAARAPLYFSASDLESESVEWHYRQAWFDTAAVARSGNRGWSISPSQQGSPPLNVRVGDVTELSKLKFVFQAWFLLPDVACNEASMFLIVERDGKEYFKDAVSVNEHAWNTTDWFRVTLLTEPDVEFQPDDVVKVFVWGGDGAPFYLDDVSFYVYAAD